jgi:hypothetical protein
MEGKKNDLFDSKQNLDVDGTTQGGLKASVKIGEEESQAMKRYN